MSKCYHVQHICHVSSAESCKHHRAAVSVQKQYATLDGVQHFQAGNVASQYLVDNMIGLHLSVS
jgi:hypothetical protein